MWKAIVVISFIALGSIGLNIFQWKYPRIVTQENWLTNKVVVLSNVYVSKPVYIPISTEEYSNLNPSLKAIVYEYSNYVFSDVEGKITNYNRNGDMLSLTVNMSHWRNTNIAKADLYVPNYRYLANIGYLQTKENQYLTGYLGYRPFTQLGLFVGAEAGTSIKLDSFALGVKLGWAF